METQQRNLTEKLQTEEERKKVEEIKFQTEERRKLKKNNGN